MKKRCLMLAAAIFLPSILASQPAVSPESEIWRGTAEQRLWGLMTVWAQTKFSFPHIERLKEISWDETARSFIPRVLAAPDEKAYFDALAELAALLGDSHTEVIPPWGPFTPGYDNPPIEAKVIDERFYIVRTGQSEEIARFGIVPGMEILSVAGIPVREYFRDTVLKYHTRGSEAADRAVLPFYLLYGPRGEKVRLELMGSAARTRTVELTRNSATRGAPFSYAFVEHAMASGIDFARLPGDVLYIDLPNFQEENGGIRDGFLDLIDAMDLSAVEGMIIDLRYNLGGSEAVMRPIVASLIDSAAEAPPKIYYSYSAAHLPWGKEPVSWKTQRGRVEPREGRRYLGPLALLIGPCTHSSAEDMVIELAQAGRCVTVGEPTAGGAGGSLSFPLPGGGMFQVSTFKSTWPDGTEYMNAGIVPDIFVSPSLRDILSGADPVLETALRALKERP